MHPAFVPADRLRFASGSLGLIFATGRQWSAYVVATLVLAGCSQGYPTSNAPDTRSMGAAQHLAAINGMLASDPDHASREALLVNACTLRFTALLSSRHGVRVALARAHAVFDTNAKDGEYQVKVFTGGRLTSQPRFTVNVGTWLNAVAFRDHLQELVRRCWAIKRSRP
ncbi:MULTISPECIES: hypothetical protein [unclassified Variovorax]|jgi:hypothetical protein|uniref:hypothetical protein n=1 Tax=unclassified Variovorax TaxID=663243 RepID=UPI002B2324A2|nr:MULTISPECIES: hypothetical protein [unclassified Variovorax]MEB0057592.1 hypothetical protein [Variovorax sp. LG9.2]MEB0114148.1 hypothetical protein [Variovorax sp. RTB1]